MQQERGSQERGAGLRLPPRDRRLIFLFPEDRLSAGLELLLGSAERLPMSTRFEMAKELIAEVHADEVGLWFIVARIRDEVGDADPDRLQRETLECIELMLASGKVSAGSHRPDGRGLEPWHGDQQDILNRIAHEWNELGRIPDIGEIVVFVGLDGATS